MDKRLHTIRTRRVTLLLLATVGLSGCGVTDWVTGRSAKTPVEPSILGAPRVEDYVFELGRVASGDRPTQAEIVADASSEALLTPGTSANLRLGLVLAIPGHSGSDPARAKRLLSEVLEDQVLLTPGETALATIHLNSAERQIAAASQARQLRSSDNQTAQTQEQAVADRLTAAEAENRRLRLELQEAQEKLDAITNIERSIREQE